MPDYIGEAVEKIRVQVGAEEVILGLSGGVDSSVAAALLHRAIGDQLTCVLWITTVAFERSRAGDGNVCEEFGRESHPRRCRAEFLKHLKGVSDPEQSAKSSGREFVEVSSVSRQAETSQVVAQGTIYPDVIESAGAKNKKAHTIKSHHTSAVCQTLTSQIT